MVAHWETCRQGGETPVKGHIQLDLTSSDRQLGKLQGLPVRCLLCLQPVYQQILQLTALMCMIGENLQQSSVLREAANTTLVTTA